jgi:preprotein translocase subunit SecA
MRRFGGDRIKGFLQWVGMDEDTPIENALLTKAITDVQRRVEGYHFDMRKHLVEYDDVVNKHREVIYGERKKILSGADLKANILSMVREEIQSMVAARTGNGRSFDQDLAGLLADAATIFPLPPTVNANALAEMKPKQIEDNLIELAETLYQEREKEIGSENMRVLERLVMLRIIDNLWVEHLTMMEDMRQGIGLMAAGQRDPLVAYKREGHNFFENLLSTIQHDVVHTIYHVGIVRKEAPREAPTPMAQVAAGGADNKKQPVKAAGKKVGRNDPCPCGSGKKYKKCCGR